METVEEVRRRDVEGLLGVLGRVNPATARNLMANHTTLGVGVRKFQAFQKSAFGLRRETLFGQRPRPSRVVRWVSAV